MRFLTAPHRCRGRLKRRSWKLCLRSRFIGERLPIWSVSLILRSTIIENDKTEHTTGTLHYDAVESRVVVEVKAPLKQILVVKDKVLEIYYPLDNRAFRFIAKTRVPLPLVESFLQSTQAAYGLTAIGYSLDRHEIADNVLYTYWTPPAKSKDKLGAVILGSRDGRLISAETKIPDGQLTAKSLFRSHTRLGDSYFPMEVVYSLYGPKSELLEHEHLIYSKPQLNAQPSAPILQFEIPKSVKIKEIKW